MASDLSRPSFYALASGGWRDYVTVLHPPYTAWHLSYVAIGAALTPAFSLSRLIPTLTAFFLAVGVGAHALDELRGGPEDADADAVLVALSAASLALAVGIGVVGAAVVDPWIAVFVVVGSFLVLAYNLELFDGRFHTDRWFALSWGSFPVLTGFFAASGTIGLPVLLGALFAFALASRSAPLHASGTSPPRRPRDRNRDAGRRLGGRITAAELARAEEVALQALAAATVALPRRSSPCASRDQPSEERAVDRGPPLGPPGRDPVRSATARDRSATQPRPDRVVVGPATDRAPREAAARQPSSPARRLPPGS